MKDFIEKQIKRLEELSIPIYDSDGEIVNKVVLTDIAKNIVNQLAEEYINTSTTNADKIRSMTDEELAEFLCKLDTMGTEPKSLWNGEFWIDEGEELLNWLQSEVEGE